jgi:hypothetical protein
MASAREAPRDAAPPADPAAGPAAPVAGAPPPGARAPAPVAAILALGLVLLGGLLLRLDNIAHGLPFVYHADEAFHFTSRAVAMFGGDLNPHYFQNPSAFTYLLHGVLRLTGGGDVAAAYARDPTGAFLTGRILATVLCLLGAAGVFAVGRRLWGPAAGVAAAAVLTFAFLPVAYSRLALTDVAVFLPIALALYATIRVREDGARRWFLLAGAAIGLAVGVKYTAGLLVVPLLVAAWLRARGGQPGVLREAAFGLALAAVVFLATTPYFLLDLRVALYQLKVQQQAASLPKLGPAAQDGTVVFYLRTLTWGLGWGAALAAAAGLVWEWRRDRTRAVLLALFPLLLFVYLSTAGRSFARWLMPAYPVLALFAGVALARLAGAVSRRPAIRAGALVVLLAAVLAQPIAIDLHTARVLGRTDTRQLTREHLLAALPRSARVVVEPAFPVGYFGGRLRLGFGPPPKTATFRAGSVTRFIVSLRPQRIDRYRRAGYCVVVSTSDVRERARARRDPRIDAYYRRLARESRVEFRASPYRRGAAPVPFDFDLSTHLYEPSAYERPGPAVTIYRLRDCQAPTRA